MRTRARVLLPSTLLLYLLAGPFVPVLFAVTGGIAADVSYTFSGTIGSGSITPSGGVTTNVSGDAIVGAISYYSGQSETGTSGLYDFTSSANGHTFLFKITSGSTTIYADNYATSTDFQIKMGGTTGASTLVLMVNTVHKQGGSGSTPNFILDLKSTSYAGGLTLPTSTTLKQFAPSTTAPATFSWDPDNGNFGGGPGYGDGSGGITSLDQSGLSVPEPSSLLIVILVLATGSVGCLIRRKPWAPQSVQIAPLPQH
jgi:hypothetical protein